MKLLGLPSTGPLAGLLAIMFSFFLFIPLISKINSTSALKDNGELVNGYNKAEDVAADIRHYLHPLQPHMPSSDGAYLFIQFIGTNLSDKLTVKLWVAYQYTDSEWHFIHELIFKTDNSTYTIPITPTRDCSVRVDQSSHRTTTTYWEYDTFYLQRKMFEDIAVSKNLLVSFRGKTKYQDLTFDSYVKRRGIIDAYNAYRSNPNLYQFLDELEKDVQKAASVSETIKSKEQHLFDIVLTSVSSDTMTTVKMLMNLCNINLHDAMEKAKNLPSIIQENISESKAEQLKKEFQQVGAEVEILDHA